MPENLESKFRISQTFREEIRDACRCEGAECQWLRRQVDTYFICDSQHGEENRFLKLRQEVDLNTGQGTFELISYKRPTVVGGCTSLYEKFPCERDKDGLLLRTLSLVLPPVRIIIKERELWILGATRIHIDWVEHLRHFFVELETTNDDAREHADVIRKLGLDKEEPVRGSYANLCVDALGGD